jgi:hypothetical protein
MSKLLVKLEFIKVELPTNEPISIECITKDHEDHEERKDNFISHSKDRNNVGLPHNLKKSTV